MTKKQRNPETEGQSEGSHRAWRTRYTREELVQIGLAIDARIAGLRQGLEAATEDAKIRISYAREQWKKAKSRIAKLEAELAALNDKAETP